MKLVFTIFRYFPYGGLQLDFARFLQEGIRRGHSVTVLYDRWEGDFFTGAEYRELKCEGLTNWGRALDFERKAAAELAGGKFDRVIGFNRMAGLDFYYAADICFAGSSQQAHPLAGRILPRYRAFRRMEQSVFGAGGKTVILYLTEAQKAEYQHYYGTEEDRFRYLPPGVPEKFRLYEKTEAESARRRIRAEFQIPDGALLLVQVCSSFRTKGVDRVLQALAGLPAEWRDPQRLRYLAAGNEDPREYRKQAGRLGVGGQVIFAGPRADVPDLLNAADLMVHPARNEAAGSVLAEALVCGLPVICSGACGYASLVNEAGGVVLPEPFTVSALRDALELSLGLPNALSGLRQAAVRYAENADFHHRTECFWKFIEEAAHA